MRLIQSEVRDINGNGTPEILCAVQDIGRQDGGRMLAFDHRGNLLWQFDTTLEFQNFPRFDGAKMTLLGFLAARLDDASPRNSLVLATFEAHGWFPLRAPLPRCRRHAHRHLLAPGPHRRIHPRRSRNHRRP